MLILCCGDRRWKDQSLIRDTLLIYYRAYSDLTILEGDCRGADRMARAAALSLRIAVETIPADWGKYGHHAGWIRNRVMLDRKPELVVAFHDFLETSAGTRDCLIEATDRSIPVHCYQHSGHGAESVIDRDGRRVHFLPF